MATRTESKDVVFVRPFILDGMDAVQPAGTYRVETDEERIDALSFPAWRRVRTSILIGEPGTTQYLPIDPEQLHEALMRDGAQQNPSLPLSATGPKARRDRARGMRHMPRRKF